MKEQSSFGVLLKRYRLVAGLSQEALAAGEKEARLHVLNAWRESAMYSDRERAALAQGQNALPAEHECDHESCR